MSDNISGSRTIKTGLLNTVQWWWRLCMDFKVF